MDQVLGVGDGAAREFALRKAYRSGLQVYWRPVVKPVAGSVRASIAGRSMVEAEAWAVDPATGVITFADPVPDGAEVRAGFEFDVPVRFDIDRIAVAVASFQAGDVPAVPVVEVRL